MLPRAIPKAAKRSTRYKSPAHRAFVRSRACAACDSAVSVECAHVRLGSGAGLAMKPDDWRAVGLCSACHRRQHEQGEASFWQGKDVDALIDAYCRASPKAREIREHRNADG